MKHKRAIKNAILSAAVSVLAFLTTFVTAIFCSNSVPTGTETPTPVQTNISATETQNRGTLASVGSTTPTAQPTAISTQTPTAEPAYCYECTPTPITQTPAIIELTALGGYPTPSEGVSIREVDAQFLPAGGNRVRSSPDTSTLANVLDTLGSAPVCFYAELTVHPQGDIWLCLDAPPALYVVSECLLMTAYQIGSKTFGVVVTGGCHE